MIDEIVIRRPSGNVTTFGALASQCRFSDRDALESLTTNPNYREGSTTVFAPEVKEDILTGDKRLVLGPPINDSPQKGDVVVRILNDSEPYTSLPEMSDTNETLIAP